MTSKPWIVPKLTPAERRTQRRRRADFWARETMHHHHRGNLLSTVWVLLALALVGVMILAAANTRLP